VAALAIRHASKNRESSEIIYKKISHISHFKLVGKIIIPENKLATKTP
jgi:hypothetical protein